MQSNNVDVIIIGAGISGIGASSELTKGGVSHMILESRDRIGGRIASFEFDGVSVEIGASFVHRPQDEGHLISEYLERQNWPVRSANFSNETYFYENEGILQPKITNRAWQTVQKFERFAEKQLLAKDEDSSVGQIFEQFSKLAVDKKEQHLKNAIRWNIDIHGNVEGAQLDDLSMRQYLKSDCQTEKDYLPVGGYSQVFASIFKNCKSQIHLSHKVDSVDFTGECIKVIANNSVFHCKKVISSIPLGLMQKGRVQFIPNLPNQYKNALNGIGNGVANKLFVSFDQPFWGKRTGWLNFVTKNRNNKYPVAMIVPEKSRNILCVFVSGDASIQISQWTDEAVADDFAHFVTKFVKEKVEIRAIKLTRWHLDEHSLGSYSYCKVGQNNKTNAELLNKPIQSKIWLVGQHLHPQLNACAHSAFQTGVRAAKEVIADLESIKLEKSK